MRLFVAINWSDGTRARLLALLDELRFRSAHGNFSLPENLHLTLVFIGEVSPKKLDKVKAILETVTFERFDVSIERIGRFKRDDGDIWWASLRKDAPLMDLQREIEHKLALCGFEPDGRRYNPHITRGRRVVTDAAPWQPEPFGETVTSFALMKSERINGKLTYTAVYKKNAIGEFA
jgi:2'-5' RNA ligase